MWALSHRADRAALPLADRHYNRQKIGSPQFVPPGRCLVLLHESGRALWVTSWPLEEYTHHEWAGAWVNSLFRNEGAGLSSDLIRRAVSHTVWAYGAPPRLGMITFVDESKIESVNPGYCYKRAGFKVVGRTKVNRLLALRLAPEDMPAPSAPIGAQFALPLGDFARDRVVGE